MTRAHVLVRLVPGLDASAVEQIRVILEGLRPAGR